MLEHPSIRRYSFIVSPHQYGEIVSSENPSGADNQQETSITLELDPRWVVGFVDGEGCFSVSVHRNAYARSTGGWQLHPVFHVYQHERYRAVLEAIAAVLGCGRLRPKGPSSSVWTLAVDGLVDLEQKVIPFFERYPPVIKQDDFRRFADIVRAMRNREHLQRPGFERCLKLAYAMNFAGKQRSRSIEEILEGSSETARQARIEQTTPELFT
jgi:LAGLIDADG DNA endonuclease family protein